MRTVIKIGSSTLTYSNGCVNIRRIETLCKIISDMMNSGSEIILVSSGAIATGVGKLNLREKPRDIAGKQAMAAIGQSELMKIYDKFFSVYGHTVAQILMTKDVLTNPSRRSAAENTFKRLLEMNCIPIVNENDSVSTDELTKFGGNDILSAHVATLCEADLLLNLSDVDGFYDSDPRSNPDAHLIERVEEINDEILAIAGGAGTSRGTGGMIAKLNAAKIVTDAGIPMFILNGEEPEILYALLDGGHIGTYFCAPKSKK